MNPTYPYIDAGTGCKITGMIAVANKILSLADNYTKIVAGHGPLGNKADLTKFRDMLITSRDRVQKLKSAQEAVAEKAFAESRPGLGPRDHQLRPVDPNRLSDALSLPAAYFPDEESVKAVRIKEQQK
ncbi:MAG TPA: hypothetical protein VI386_00420 [Candidatus Sulfotelmatobacter sp.]